MKVRFWGGRRIKCFVVPRFLPRVHAFEPSRVHVEGRNYNDVRLRWTLRALCVWVASKEGRAPPSEHLCLESELVEGRPWVFGVVCVWRRTNIFVFPGPWKNVQVRAEGRGATPFVLRVFRSSHPEKWSVKNMSVSSISITGYSD